MKIVLAKINWRQSTAAVGSERMKFHLAIDCLVKTPTARHVQHGLRQAAPIHVQISGAETPHACTRVILLRAPILSATSSY